MNYIDAMRKRCNNRLCGDIIEKGRYCPACRHIGKKALWLGCVIGGIIWKLAEKFLFTS
jgi:hypothetical protein